MSTLKEARDFANAILEMTKELEFSGEKEKEEVEIEAYAKVMENRQPLVDKLMELKKEIDSVMQSSPEFGEIKQIIGNIADLDKKHHSFLSNIKSSVVQSHKMVKQGQKIHEGYMNLPPDSGSSRFDIKQ
jgi:vacuolar-type H+-ATPase subunit E/Vma4